MRFEIPMHLAQVHHHLIRLDETICGKRCGMALSLFPFQPSTQTLKYRNMKACFHTHAVFAKSRHSHSYVCVLRLGLGAKSLLSFCSST